VTVSKILKG